MKELLSFIYQTLGCSDNSQSTKCIATSIVGLMMATIRASRRFHEISNFSAPRTMANLTSKTVGFINSSATGLGFSRLNWRSGLIAPGCQKRQPCSAKRWQCLACSFLVPRSLARIFWQASREAGDLNGIRFAKWMIGSTLPLQIKNSLTELQTPGSARPAESHPSATHIEE